MSKTVSIYVSAIAKCFIVIRASHKIIADDACRIRKLLVIQHVGSSPTLLKATSCRNRQHVFVRLSAFIIPILFIFFNDCCIFSTKPLYYTTIFNFQMKYTENLTIISGLVWHNHQLKMVFIFISLAIPKQALITSALKTILKSWSKHGMIFLKLN